MDDEQLAVILPGACLKVEGGAIDRVDLGAVVAAFVAHEAKGGKVTKADKEAAEKQQVIAVRQVLREYPSLWSRARRLISNAEKTLVERVAPHEGLAREFLETSLKGIRRDLGYEHAPILEKLLIEQVALAWLDLSSVQQRNGNASSGSHPLTSGAYWDQRVTGAQAAIYVRWKPSHVYAGWPCRNRCR